MGLQLVSADYLHEDGITNRIRRDTLEQDFTIEENRDGAWVDCGLDQAVKDVKIMKHSDACIVCNDGFDQCKSGGRLRIKKY